MCRVAARLCVTDPLTGNSVRSAAYVRSTKTTTAAYQGVIPARLCNAASRGRSGRVCATTSAAQDR